MKHILLTFLFVPLLLQAADNHYEQGSTAVGRSGESVPFTSFETGQTVGGKPVHAKGVVLVDESGAAYTAIPTESARATTKTVSTVTADGTVATIVDADVSLVLQNLGTAAVYFTKGASGTTSTGEILNGSPGTDLSGGRVEITDWNGVVSVAFGATGTKSLRVIKTTR